ncbi:MAG TPA: DUF2000 domain-containing protein [Patescibacteria group bacterium]|nr:DUF2000 domain-containing protein [Patescibacteria group bacterium]
MNGESVKTATNEAQKVVMVVDRNLPLGRIANTTAVLGISLGNLWGEMVGPDLTDADGQLHRGITTQTIPVLSGDAEQLLQLREKLTCQDFTEVTVIGFTETAQQSLDYAQYARRLATVGADDLKYVGLCLQGPVKKINRLTGNMALLR